MSKMTTVLTVAMPHATVAPVARAKLHRQKLAHSLNTNVHANSLQTIPDARLQNINGSARFFVKLLYVIFYIITYF